MHGMLIGVTDKEQAARQDAHSPSHASEVEKACCRGDGINFEDEPHDLGIRTRDSRVLIHCCA